MSEVRKAEFSGTWQDETERLRDIRPEGFGPRRFEKSLVRDNENFREELQKIYTENVHTSDETNPDNTVIFIGSFGAVPLEPASIHYIAMKEAGLPVYFQGTGSSAESENIYQKRPVPATGKSKRICLTWTLRHLVSEIRNLEHLAANEQPLGILIENTVAGRNASELSPLCSE